MNIFGGLLCYQQYNDNISHRERLTLPKDLSIGRGSSFSDQRPSTPPPKSSRCVTLTDWLAAAAAACHAAIDYWL